MKRVDTEEAVTDMSIFLKALHPAVTKRLESTQLHIFNRKAIDDGSVFKVPPTYYRYGWVLAGVE